MLMHQTKIIIMKKKAFILFITCLIFTQVALSQINEADRVRITRVYEEAEKLYRVGSYAASIDYLKREGGVLLNTSDSLQYLKIKNLENIYRTDHGLTIELESSLKLFFGKVNKYSFPELKYDEVTAIYTRFSGFKERDKAFYDSVSRAFDLNKEVSLVSVRNITSDYLKINPNTYYSKELNDYVSSINNKLSELESKRRRLALDSTFHDRLKMVGKRL